ncbi:MAG TPA: 2-oxoglutarate dehydrogenase E1 component [Desulfuromonadales bacterium]|nr:2-oxoglutarate dehydrogenase E1 component [Desulfuromonadales bacterium]
MEEGFLAQVSDEWLESLHNDWKRDRSSVPPDWHAFFSGFELASTANSSIVHQFDAQQALKQSGVQSLIYRYRTLGHLLACTDPLSPCQLHHPLLELSEFGLDEHDLDTTFTCRRYMKQQATLREILTVMRASYCQEIGVEFMHIQDPDERQWLIDRMEPCRNQPGFSAEEKTQILTKLHQSAQFESFLHRRFIGQKRFSLEGGDVLIPVLDRVVRICPEAGISDLVLGMSHRGRLNVLAHIFNKSYEAIFAEFQDVDASDVIGDGDVKYHKGYSHETVRDGRRLHLTITANPSHLEAVNAVVEGKSRARQDRYAAKYSDGSDGAASVLPVLIHGDAAFSGQGSIMELLNMSRLDGYSTGGTLHIVLNNQIGFTTLPRDSRSTRYATDVAKMLACPVFHIQGEAPEAALHIVNLAMEYRRTYRSDVVIELICYRRHGHNEGDEPAFTQPLMYRQISERPPVNRIYAETLAAEGIVTQETLQRVQQQVTDALEASFGRQPEPQAAGFSEMWSGISREYSDVPVATAITADSLVSAARRLAELPAGFTAHPKINTLMQKRCEAVVTGSGIDWGNAETLAYATLLEQGISVRISGQDSRRGTFNHRHCVVVDTHDERSYTPLDNFTRNGSNFQVWNSMLSEFAVLGFEYGYSLETPYCLTLWEAQFGDFANGAQVIIDQFIAGGESKWDRASGLVLLLPHGYEGQGAEHSSARIERFLQLCAHENMVVANPSTPAQMFHLLRRQMLQLFRKPLIVFTPKSLLRHQRCSSSLTDLSAGTFQTVIADMPELAAAARVLLCSGKVYYDLLEERQRGGRGDVGLVRLEQLYPLDRDEIRRVLTACRADCTLVWVQEEPENMGAWHSVSREFARLQLSVSYIGRPADACPAVGSHHLHAEQQAEIVRQALYE